MIYMLCLLLLSFVVCVTYVQFIANECEVAYVELEFWVLASKPQGGIAFVLLCK